MVVSFESLNDCYFLIFIFLVELVEALLSFFGGPLNYLRVGEVVEELFYQEQRFYFDLVFLFLISLYFSMTIFCEYVL